MEMTLKSKRASEIIKALMENYNFSSVRSFADAIGANYMQVYYVYVGRVKHISSELENSIINTFPEVSREYLKSGSGEMFGKPKYQDGLGGAEMFALLDRITVLYEKMQEMTEKLNEREERLLAMEEKFIESNHKN